MRAASPDPQAVVDEHRAALVRGERRVLRLTRSGEPHSYAPDEIGLGPVVSGTQVTSWWGLSVLAALLAAVFAASWLIVLLPVADGHGPAWGGLAVTALSAGVGCYVLRLAHRQHRARRVRRLRGVPEPSDLPVPDRWADPAAPDPRARSWRRRPWWWVAARAALSGMFVLAAIGAGSAGVLATAGAGLVLTVVVPVAAAAHRVTRRRG
ncbi:hypothetical protein [Pimelobacter simplex]|uniref:hypothetical protein n=1 Tax=Nocardioides simplex TaxID=2045 RepID=UPI00214FDAF2|nr:hypothetical protein [Pimelobacter simplex]UUW90398.1 hypothetical protein M0M43_02605 [Pimelobacter simplex]UUW94228.1 hypothetical protein M0M48_21120 [Pimelobacter simplex]